jgi:hypothetical protein
MKLLAIGDSFTYGDELDNTQSAWPYRLAELTNSTVINLGLPSKGNSYIVRSAITQAKNCDIVIVAWSHFARIEFADEFGIYDLWPGISNKTFTHRDVIHRTRVVEYLTEYYNDVYLYNQYLINIIQLQSYFKQHNIKYLMLDAFGNNENRQLGDPELIKQVDTTHYLGWPNDTMMEWTYGVAQGSGGHFLEQGHRIVAGKINEHIRRLGWVS